MGRVMITEITIFSDYETNIALRLGDEGELKIIQDDNVVIVNSKEIEDLLLAILQFKEAHEEQHA